MVIDATDDRFLIRCPLWANDVVRRLPSVRWQKGAKAWAAPLVKQNLTALDEIAQMGGVQLTDAARHAMDRLRKTVEQIGQRGTGFPTWYPFKTQPRKHQWPALNQGYGLHAFFLNMDMQTGKSFTALTLATAHHMEDHVDAALLFSKRTLRRNWLEQLDTHCPIPWNAYLPDTDKYRQFRKWMESDTKWKQLVVGWESLSQGGMGAIVDEFIGRFNGRIAIIGDETTYISGHKATRAKLVVGYGRRAAYRYALAGIMDGMEGPEAMFMQWEFLDPQIIGIGDPTAFRNRYCVMGGYEREVRPGKKVPTKVVGYQNLDELNKLIAPYSYVLPKTAAYDLPPKRFEVRTAVLTQYQREVYNTVKKEGVLSFHGSEEQVLQNVLEVYLRLHQVTGGYAVKPREVLYRKKDGSDGKRIVYDPVELIAPQDNPKMIEVVEYVEELKKSKQFLLWAVYEPEISALIGLLERMGLKIGRLDGKVKDADRQPMINRFRGGDLHGVVGNAATGGMGYSMPEAEVNMFFNNTFKALDRRQAEDRNYGDGTTKPGMWVDFIGEKTVDVVIKKAVDEKQDLSEYLRSRLKDMTAMLDGETP
jgi:hypothetical protein